MKMILITLLLGAAALGVDRVAGSPWALPNEEKSAAAAVAGANMTANELAVGIPDKGGLPAAATPENGLVATSDDSELSALSAAIAGSDPNQLFPDVAICQHKYYFIMTGWVMVAAPKWWQRRYHDNAHHACDAWKASLKRKGFCGLHISMCERRTNFYGDDLLQNWLHMRGTTCIGRNYNRVESSIRETFDTEEDTRFTVTCRSGRFG